MSKKLQHTPSQTIGPFFAYGLTPAEYGKAPLVENKAWQGAAPGETIHLVGRVIDGNGEPITDGLLEIWQPDSTGNFVNLSTTGNSDPGFTGFARCGTDSAGEFRFDTVKPGVVLLADGRSQAPHINLTLFLRGLLVQVFSRIYFSDEIEANMSDPLLNCIDESRRHTLLAHREENGNAVVYRFDVFMQGENETVFLDGL